MLMRSKHQFLVLMFVRSYYSDDGSDGEYNYQNIDSDREDYSDVVSYKEDFLNDSVSKKKQTISLFLLGYDTPQMVHLLNPFQPFQGECLLGILV